MMSNIVKDRFWVYIHTLMKAHLIEAGQYYINLYRQHGAPLFLTESICDIFVYFHHKPKTKFFSAFRTVVILLYV